MHRARKSLLTEGSFPSLNEMTTTSNYQTKT